MVTNIIMSVIKLQFIEVSFNNLQAGGYQSVTKQNKIEDLAQTTHPILNIVEINQRINQAANLSTPQKPY